MPGEPVVIHPGGTMTADTTGGPSLLSAPASCDPGGGTTGAPERAFLFDNQNALTNLRLSTQGSSIDTVLYVRYADCALPGPDAYCDDDSGGSSTSLVDIPSPATGYYFAVVDSRGATGPVTLNIAGTVDRAGTCSPADPSFVCANGLFCGASGTCEPTACNDGLDNDGDGRIDYPFDPGCPSIADLDETDPIPTPQCGDGLDNDGDGLIDYPADPDCDAASDDDESCATFGSTASGYRGCQTIPMILPCDDVRATGSLGCAGDDCTSVATLPFAFGYFGVAQTTVTISSNGKLGFPATSVYTNTCTTENNTIAVYWDDLYPPSGGSIRYQVLGSAPNRRFVANWNVPHIGGGGLYDIRAVLYEGTNDIDMCYVNTSTGGAGTDSGASATVGIRNASGTEWIDFSCNSPVVTNGLLLRFQAP